MKEVKLMIDDCRDRCNVITALVNAGYEIKMIVEMGIPKNDVDKVAEEIDALFAETMPTEEADRWDAEEFLGRAKDIWNHPRITDRCDKESYEVADLMSEFANEWFRNRMKGEEK